MAWEQAARAFWPLFVILSLMLAALALGAVAAVPAPVLPWLFGAAMIGALVTAVRGGMRWRRVSGADAAARVDAALPGRPLSALADHAALGGEGPLWQAHRAQMAARAAQAQAVPPDAGLRHRDPMALRLAALVGLVMALLFGGAGQIGQGMSAIAATLRLPDQRADTAPAAPSWEGWAEPPAYTRRPTIYLNALPKGDPLVLPKGTAISFRLYGDRIAVDQDIGPSSTDDPLAPGFRAEQSGAVTVSGRRFDVTVQPDDPPLIRAGAQPLRRADGRMAQEFEAEDDFGVTEGAAEIALDLAAIDRRYGLTPAPEPRAPLSLSLPIPRGDTRRIAGTLTEDLARHPWANLPVTVTLQATDGIGQTGHSTPAAVILPGRRFFDPLAASLIETRRDLLWSLDNAGRSAEILRAVTWQPDGFVEPDLYQQLRGAAGLLDAGALSPEARDQLAEALWEAAVQLEDGGLADALDRMRRAQERLSEAIRQGASPDEIQRLMDELKAATDAYTQMLAEQGEDPAARFDRSPQQGQQITGDQIQQMMDEIQRLMNEGRMAEAQQLLEQFNRMMENLQVRRSQGGEGQDGQPGSQPMNRLADTLRQQQDLSDQAFREMQRQFSGQQGQDGQSGGEMADRQSDLRQQLGRQQGLMPGQGSPQGDAAREALDQAGRAMEGAEQALRDGDMAGAMERQADAIQSMREGMRALGDLMRPEGQQAQQGQQGEGAEGQQSDGPAGTRPGDQRGAMQRDGQRQLDPLGRNLSGNGGRITTGDPLAEGADPARRARDLLDEIRRRSGQMTRPEDERDYLGRLLERF